MRLVVSFGCSGRPLADLFHLGPNSTQGHPRSRSTFELVTSNEPDLNHGSRGLVQNRPFCCNTATAPLRPPPATRHPARALWRPGILKSRLAVLPGPEPGRSGSESACCRTCRRISSSVIQCEKGERIPQWIFGFS